MIEVIFMVNGGRRFRLGVFADVEAAVAAIQEHVWENSAITRPQYEKSLSDEGIRIDYGARDCYYVLRLVGQTERS